MKKSMWFYIEPYVHVQIQKDNIILYNTLNGAVIENSSHPGILELVKSLLDNRAVIELTSHHLQDPQIKDFVNEVKSKFMGDLLDSQWIKGKPFQVGNELKLFREVRGGRKSGNSLLSSDVMSHLTEISFYLNNYPLRNEAIFQNGCKQFLFSKHDGVGEENLNSELIKNVVLEAEGSSLFRLNILGGNLLYYPELEKLEDFFDSIPLIKSYYLHYIDILEHQKGFEEFRSRWCARRSIDSTYELNLLIHFPFDRFEVFERVKHLVKEGIPVKGIFIVQSSRELSNLEELMNKSGLEEFAVFPYFNGHNLEFFMESVFITKEEILEARPQRQDIFARTVLNQLHFGKINVLSNGDYYAGYIENKLGEVGSDSIYEIVMNEFIQGNCWRKTRENLSPCKDCLYQYLCPSPSLFESALGRNNLCHIQS